MKDGFLLLLPKWCAMVGTATPLLDYEFSLATKWYVEQLQTLRNYNSVGSDHIVAVVKQLVADGLLTQNELQFKLTPAGVEKIKELSNFTQAEPNTKPNTKNDWHKRVVPLAVFTIVCGVIVGIILHYVLPK